MMRNINLFFPLYLRMHKFGCCFVVLVVLFFFVFFSFKKFLVSIYYLLFILFSLLCTAGLGSDREAWLVFGVQPRSNHYIIVCVFI